MYWQEHIDILKKKFPQADFRDPFTDWLKILRQIESKFIAKSDSNYHFSNWPDNIKNQSLIRLFPRIQVTVEVSKLDPSTNYWLVVGENTPTSDPRVYDCKLTAINAVISLTKSHFYVIDKKYKWFTFFQANNDQVCLIKSGKEITPFEKEK